MRNATAVARDLLGAVLVRSIGGERVSGRIVEAEAYTGLDDLASHAYRGRTPRNGPMWEQPGIAYIYLVYGMYWLTNVICEPEGSPAGVLIRALEPLEGLDIMAANRPGVAQSQWTNGPGRLSAALGLSGETHNRADLTTGAAGVWIEAGEAVPDDRVQTGPRVGLGRNVLEPWFSMPWRWWIAGNPYRSR